MQEAEAERLEREIERRMGERAEARKLMEGEAVYEPHTLSNRDDQWECRALEAVNRGRPPWRICFSLPPRCYEATWIDRFSGSR